MLGRMTAPTVQVLAISGFSRRLPPVVRFTCPAFGGAIVPIRPAGAPCARQTAIRLGSVIAPWQGSAARLVSTVVIGVNSSEMFGARTAWLYAPRNLMSCTGAQLPANFQVVVLNFGFDERPWA